MKNLHLSDAPYLEDFDRILGTISPKYVVEIGAGDAYLLKHAYDFYKSKSLEVIALASSGIDSIRRKLVDIPHRLVPFKDISVEKALESVGITDLENCVFIEAFPEHSFAIAKGLGLIHLQQHENPIEFMLGAAKKGWMPKDGASFQYPGGYTLNFFEKRPYNIRPATLEDMKALNELEVLCWTQDLAMPESILTKRIQDYPQGQLVVEIDEKVVGVIYSQRINAIDEIYKSNYSHVNTLSNPKGPVQFILAMNIHPTSQKLRIGGQVLEFLLQLASKNPEIKQIAGVTRCLTYEGQSDVEEFIQKREDPVIRMHLAHGAELKGGIPNWRPKDIKNQGYGVLMVYPVEGRVVNVKEQAKAPSNIENLLYEIEWVETPLTNQENPPLDGLWIVFADKGEKLALKMREVLKEHLQYCILVHSGKSYEKQSGESFVINPESVEDYSKVFASIPNISQLAGVIYMWGYSPKGSAKADMNWIESHHKHSCMGLIHLANVLNELDLPVKLSVIAESISNDGTLQALAEWPLSGLVKVISEEYPQIKSFYLAIEEEVKAIYEEMTCKIAYPTILRRGGKRLTPKMVRAQLEKREKISIDPNGIYIVAGGQSAISLSLIKWYREHGAKNILTEIPESESIKGVIQVQVILEDELLRHVTWETIKVYYEPRVKEAWLLHEKCVSADHFVLFSSVISDYISTGKASHAIATAFLDALSYYRHKNGLRSLSIDWGFWATKQVILKRLIEPRQLREIFSVITEDEMFQVLDEIVVSDKPVLIVAKFKQG